MPVRRSATVVFGIGFFDEKGTRNVRFVLNVYQNSIARTWWATVFDLISGLGCVEKRRPPGVAVNIAVFIFRVNESGGSEICQLAVCCRGGGDDLICRVLIHCLCQICISFPTGSVLVHSVGGKYVSWNVGKLPLLNVAELWKSTQRTEHQPRKPKH